MDDVVVVGAGVVGLTSALRLQQRGARVTVLTADEPADTVSAVAAAVWYPSHTDEDPRVLAWAARTFDELADQALRGVPGVVLRPTRMLLRQPAEPPWWSPAVPDFRVATSAETPPGYAGEWRFTVPAVEMVPYLDWLAGQLTAGGGTLRRVRLASLGEATATDEVVVNATGLAARELAGDPAVHPTRGQVVVVANPGLHVSVRDEGDDDGPTYVHPRSRDVVLGGTFQSGDWNTTPDAATAREIVARCTRLVPELAGARVLAHRVGLRPSRRGGPRVEPQTAAAPGGPRTARLIHNYGHGGAGVTLCWGCADEVASLL